MVRIKSHRPIVVLAVLGVVLLVASVSMAQVEERYVDPRQWASPAGHYVLEMDPSDPEGLGPAWYTLRQDGSVVWSGRHPFTMRGAVVTDEGSAVGYAHSKEEHSRFLLGVCLSPHGEVLNVDARPRVIPGGLAAALDRGWADLMPMGRHVWLFEEKQLAAVSVATDGTPQWLLYSTVSGEHKGDIELPGSVGERYALTLNEDGTWRAGRPAALAADDLPRAAGPRGNELPHAAPAWNGRALRATRLGEIELRAPRPSSPIRDVHGFDLDDRGQIGWVRRADAPATVPQFVLIDADGDVVAEHELVMADLKDAHVQEIVWLAGDHWLILRQWFPGGIEPHAELWLLNWRSGEFARILQERTGVDRVCRTPDGWAMLVGDLTDRTVHRYRFDPASGHHERVEIIPVDRRGRTDDICVLDDGTLVSLSAVPFRLHLWGQHDTRTIELEGGLLGAGRIYAAGIKSTPNGGLAVLESAESERVHLLNADGTHRSSLDARGPGGEPFNLYDNWRFDSQGELWASDSNRLFRVGQQGVDRTLGPTQGDAMGDPIAITRAVSGEFYALELGTASIHVFGADGTRVQILRPPAGEVMLQDALAWVFVRTDGTVHFRTNYEDGSYAFDAQGAFLGRQTPRIEDRDWLSPVSWRVIGGGDGLWARKSEEIRRMDAAGAQVMHITRRPSGAWLRNVMMARAGPDNSLAWVSAEFDHTSRSIHAKRAWLCVVEADGAPRMELEIDPPHAMTGMHYDGRRVILDMQDRIISLDTHTSEVGIWTRHTPQGGWGELIEVTSDGEWLTWNQGERRIERWRVE